MCILYFYIYKFKFTIKCHTQTLPHPRSGNSKGQETFLAPYAEYIIYMYNNTLMLRVWKPSAMMVLV